MISLKKNMLNIYSMN